MVVLIFAPEVFEVTFQFKEAVNPVIVLVEENTTISLPFTGTVPYDQPCCVVEGVPVRVVPDQVVGVEYLARTYGRSDASSGLGAGLGCQRCLLGGLGLLGDC